MISTAHSFKKSSFTIRKFLYFYSWSVITLLQFFWNLKNPTERGKIFQSFRPIYLNTLTPELIQRWWQTGARRGRRRRTRSSWWWGGWGTLWMIWREGWDTSHTKWQHQCSLAEILTSHFSLDGKSEVEGREVSRAPREDRITGGHHQSGRGANTLQSLRSSGGDHQVRPGL